LATDGMVIGIMPSIFCIIWKEEINSSLFKYYENENAILHLHII